MKRYYELVLSGRQLVFLLLTIGGMLLLAFSLGVGVGLLQPQGEEGESSARAQVVAVAPPAQTQKSEMSSEPWPPAAPTGPPAPRPSPPPTAVAELLPPLTPSPVPSEVAVAEETFPRATKAPVRKVEVWVQVAALSQRQDAEGVRQRVIALGFRPNQVRILGVAGGKYRVRVGPFPDKESGMRVSERLRASGYPKAFVVAP